MRQQELIRPSRQECKMGLDLGTMGEAFLLGMAKGRVFFDLHDPRTGQLLEHWEQDNVVTKDAGILAARLFRDSQDPTPGSNNGLTMLGVGTGATGNLLSPDAPQTTQRRLNTEIARKPFALRQFRNASGVAVAYPTNIVDFTTTFTEAEAVGPLNEMALMSTFSPNPLILNPIMNGPSGYDSTIDVTGKDICANYLTFACVAKPNGAILTITWRFTF